MLLGREMADRLVVAGRILSQLMFLTLRKGRESCHLLTTDDRNVHLNARPNNNKGVIARPIIINSSCFD